MSLARRLAHRLGISAASPPAVRRWAVVDVETTGLDVHHDHLLAIAAVALHIEADADAAPHLVLADSFEVVLRHEAVVADKSNILLHGIGIGAQREGVAPAEALSGFERWLGAAPLIAFHAAFDQAMLQRAFDAAGLRWLANPWLDLEPLAAVACPRVRARSLDEWMAAFDIRCARRHQAAADTLATAELLLRLWPAIRRELPRPDFAGLQRLAAHRRWMPGT